MFNVKDIEDSNERVWFLGTDVLNESDLDILGKSDAASFQHVNGYATIFNVWCDNMSVMAKDGFSKRFLDIIAEANKRGYTWVAFDCDIVTSHKD